MPTVATVLNKPSICCKGAVSDYTQSIKIEPNDADIYFKRGRMYLLLENIAEAVADYSQVIKLEPDCTEAYFIRGCLFSDLEDYQGAISDLTEVIKKIPNNANAYLQRGNARIEPL